MKYGIIIGSHRAQSQSAKIGGYAQKVLTAVDASSQFYTVDLSKKPLPLWDEGVWKGDEAWKAVWGPMAAELKSCDAFVVMAPEYSGMVPAALKNFFLLAGRDELGHKPGLIVGVSSGLGGSYPVQELRMSSYKNSRLNWIPEHMVVRNSEHVLNGDVSQSADDTFVRARFEYCLRLLGQYGKALALVRESGVVDYKNHPNGM
jgi:NAD(P)H-dependent FMN reductase